MGVSLNVIFDKRVAPYGTLSDDHNVLGNGLTRLDKALAKAGLPTLGQYVSIDPAEMKDMDEDDPEALAFPPEQWFPPADGLAAVRAAADYLRQHPKSIPWRADTLEELALVEAELTAAARRKARFHFGIFD